MLTQVSVENFKSLKHLDLRLKPLTIFIGSNGSGKSGILQLKASPSRAGRRSVDNIFPSKMMAILTSRQPYEYPLHQND